jgi:hypothetical protein
MDLIGSGWRLLAGSCEQSIEVLRAIEVSNLLDKLRDNQLLTKDSDS